MADIIYCSKIDAHHDLVSHTKRVRPRIPGTLDGAVILFYDVAAVLPNFFHEEPNSDFSFVRAGDGSLAHILGSLNDRLYGQITRRRLILYTEKATMDHVMAELTEKSHSYQFREVVFNNG